MPGRSVTISKGPLGAYKSINPKSDLLVSTRRVDRKHGPPPSAELVAHILTSLFPILHLLLSSRLTPCSSSALAVCHTHVKTSKERALTITKKRHIAGGEDILSTRKNIFRVDQ